MVEANVVEVNAGEFDRITLDPAGSIDVMEIAEKLAAGQDDSAEAKAKADAEAKAKADADAKAKEEAEAKAKVDAEAKAKLDAEAQRAASGTQGERVDGVLLKDGKHVAPYAVLEGARQRESAANKAREEAETRAKELETELANLKSGKTSDPSRAAVLSDELRQRIAALQEGAPEVGEVLAPLLQAVDSMGKQLAEMRTQDERAVQETHAEGAREVQEAIDRNAALRYLQAEDPKLWNKVVDQDMVLRRDPDNANLSFDERFTMALKAVEATHGAIQVPDKYQDSSKLAEAKAKVEAEAKAKADAEAKAKTDAAGQTKAKEDAAARAKAELERAAKDKAITLTDLPGGAPPQSNDKALAEKTPDEIAAQVDTFLAKGGRIQDLASLWMGG